VSVLEVPGARLYYETRGSGPPLVLVPGANGDARVFGPVATQLSRHYTVIVYDRRGFSRSVLAGAQHYERRLHDDADDAWRLIERVSGEPATVFGTSSGGVVALELITRHPEAVRMLVPHEPAAISLLPDAPEWLDFFSSMYDLYRRSGIEPALQAFREKMFAGADLPLMANATANRELNDLAHANVMYWFERELRQYTAVRPDLEALTAVAGHVMPAAGRRSRGYPTYRVSLELARDLGRPLTEFPGGHVGYAAEPAEFAAALARTVPH
jgi:pimeloyl-ACP methyl ester carboxylesterase